MIGHKWPIIFATKLLPSIFLESYRLNALAVAGGRDICGQLVLMLFGEKISKDVK